MEHEQQTSRPTLRELERCFMGAVPATIATCSPEGIPNITYLSIVHRVDDSRLALSFQFFNKTRENVLANSRAQILLPDPVKMEQYRIDVVYEATEYEGPIFERMRANLDAVASQMGMQGVFRLQGADVYRVLAIEKLAHDLELQEAPAAPDFVAGLETLSGRLAECDDLETLLDKTLVGLAELFDYQHAMVLLADESGRRLYTVASHGFEPSGIGAEIAMGEGLLGAAAAERRPIRIGNLRVEQTLAQAVRSIVHERGEAIDVQREIPLPGLALARSQLAVPIPARDRCLGVLCVQSSEPGRLSQTDERILGTLARYLATSMQLLGHSSIGDAPASRAYGHGASTTEIATVRHHPSDDSIFIDDEYVIKGLPGRILVRLLRLVERDGRVDFTNRELRLDESLQLSAYRDNLEARLILLRRRLEERTEVMRLTKTGRGRFRLELRSGFRLREER
jgi:adenylate cyclase